MKRHLSSALLFIGFYLLNLGVHLARTASRWVGVNVHGVNPDNGHGAADGFPGSDYCGEF